MPDTQARVLQVTWNWRAGVTRKDDTAAFLRRAAVVQAVVMGAVAATLILGWHHVLAGRIVAGLALVVLFLGLVWPTLYRPVHSFGQTLGRVVGTVLVYVLLAPFFYLFFTPAALLLRLMGRDPLHRKFKECEEDRGRYLSHLLTFYGFVGLFITTGLAVLALYVFHNYPLPLFHPIKILGNLSTIVMLTGLTLMIRDRVGKTPRVEKTSANDWTFLILLVALVVTGALTEFLRFANAPGIAYPTYFVHLMLVFATLVYLPYSRFAHMIYRTVAMVYARHSGRDKIQ